VDPFSIGSLDTYLSRFDEAFKGFRAPLPRAQFQDSFEYYGANWTPLLFSEFARRRGYDLREHLAELAGQADPDSASRVREDYRRTIGELHQEFVARWTAWSHAHGSLTREQAHGAPANIEDVYAIADIPETEGSFGGSAEEQVPMLKFASSAAHVTGRTLASSETFTWLGEHFQVPLSQLKGAADTFLLSGINHIFLHGIPYSPADAPWPGWLFYASVNFGPNGGLWHDLPAFNAYITRCQSILQAGKPDNDILLYFPVADFWQRTGSRVPANDPLVLQFTTPGKWMEGSPFHAAAMELWRKGFSYDEVTDALLERARAEAGSESGGPQGGSILIGGNRYRAIVVPACSFMPVETLRHLLELVRNGGTVIFAGGVPTDVPGVAGLEARQAEMRSLAGGIPFGAPEGGVLMAHLGNGRVLSAIASLPPIEPGVARILVAAGIPRETMADDNLRCIRRARETGFDYFIVNMGDRPIDKWVTLSRPGRSAALFDPLVPDHNGIAATRAAKEGIGVFLHMAPGQSYIVRTSEGEAPQAAAWYYLEPAAQPSLVIVGDWSVHFLDGGPALPSDFHGAGLGSWADREDPEAKRFAGTAVYAISFELPQHSGVDHWRLDLGRVAESARVRINGQEAAKLWCAPFSTDVGRFLHPGENRLEVEVTNLAANRVRDLDLRHVDWKRFYEINFVNHAYRPFDASGWPIRDSGLLGPVTLTPLLPEASPFLGK
jgi:hypothetical protein